MDAQKPEMRLVSVWAPAALVERLDREVQRRRKEDPFVTVSRSRLVCETLADSLSSTGRGSSVRHRVRRPLQPVAQD